MNLAEFFVSLIFDGDEQGVNDMDNALNDLDKTIENLKLAALAVGIERVLNATVMATAELMNFNAQTGISIERLQAFQSAANMANVSLSFEQVANSVNNLQQNLAQIRLGGGNVAPFQLLGIDTTGKDALEVIEDIRGAIKGLDDATATNLIQQTGLTPEFIRVLRLSKEQFDALAQDGFLSREQREEVNKLGQQMTLFRIRLTNLRDNVVAAVAPAFGILFKVLGSVAEVLTKVAKEISENKLLLGALASIAAVVFAGFYPLIATLTAVAFVLDDIFTYIKGGDSIVGRFIGKVKELATTIKNFLLEPLQRAADLFSNFSLGGALSGIGNMVAGTLAPATSGGNVSNQFTNNYTINSSADAGQIADDIVNGQQRQLNYGISDINNGALN